MLLGYQYSVPTKQKIRKLLPNCKIIFSKIDYFGLGQKAFDTKDYQEALSIYLKAIQKGNSNSAAAYGNVGLCYRLLKKPDSALIFLNKCLDLAPNDIWTIKQLSATYSSLQDYKKAYSFAQKATELEAENYSNWFGLSFYALFVGKPQETIQAAKKTLELNKDAVSVETNLALGYLLNNEYAEAEKIYLKWKGKNFSDDERLCDEVFLADIADLEKAGISHSDFEKVRKLFEK